MRAFATLLFIFSTFLSGSFQHASAEEVIWKVSPDGTSMGTTRDSIISGIGPGGGNLTSADFLVAQVFVQCKPGMPRIGLPGTINKVKTFFENDGPGFDTFSEATINNDGNFEINGLARLNVFEVGANGMLPEPFENPENGPIVEVKFIEDAMTQVIEVRAENVRDQLSQEIAIQPNIRYFVGLTPLLFPLSNGFPFDGIHLTNPVGLGNEFQSAARQTFPIFEKEWRPAGDDFDPPNPLFGTIQINGPPLFLLGDANMDGVVNLLDVDPFIMILSSGKFSKETDIDGDGFVNLLDVAGFVEILAGGP